MADIVWPITLPAAPLLAELSGTFADVALRTQMDAGPAKVRRRFTTQVEPFSIGLSLTGAQVTLLRTFFEDTTEGGALPYQWKHPQTGAAADFRFTSAPSIRPLGPRTGTGSERWRASFGVEVIPSTGVAPVVDSPDNPWIEHLQQQYLDLIDQITGEEEAELAAAGAANNPPDSGGERGIHSPPSNGGGAVTSSL